MPNSVLSVGNYSFRYYSGLADVSLSSTLSIIYEYAFGECGFSHIILPESLVSKSLSMPKTIDHINDNIIYGCSALKDVYCYVEDVPAFIGTHDPADMDDVFKSATLHVLYGKESAYKADSWWGRFANVERCDEPQVEPVKVSSITISQTSTTLKVDDTIQLTATAYPTDAANRKIKWSSSNEDVAMVTDEGFVLAMAEGTSDITAEATDGSGVKAICQVKVEKKQGSAVIITLLEFESSAVTIEQGKPVQLLVKYYPENATNKQLNWTSAKPSVATVDENGVVTGVGEGKTIISAKTTDGSNLTINCVVTVVPATGIGNISIGDVKLLVKNRHLQVIGLADNERIKVVNAIGFIVY